MSKKAILITIIIVVLLAVTGATILLLPKKEDNTPPPPPFMEQIGIGGGGAFFNPMIDPTDENKYYVTSDMGGLYYSHNKGETWSRSVTKGVYRETHIANNGVIFAGGYGLYASFDSGKTMSLIYPKDVKYSVSRCGWNENLMLADDFNNGHIKCITTNSSKVYFITIDWEGKLRLFESDYSGDNLKVLYEEQTSITNPVNEVDMHIVYTSEGLYYSTNTEIYFYSFNDKTIDEIFSGRKLLDFKLIENNFYIVDDTPNQTRLLVTDDFISLEDLMIYNTLTTSFTKWGNEYSFDWHFKEICGNNYNNLYISFSSEVLELNNTVDGIMKFNGSEFEWVFDSMYKTRNTLDKNDWSYGSHGPFYGISANPHDDNMCLIANIESVYVASYASSEKRSVYTCHTKVTENETGSENYSTTGLNVQTTYFVREDPFNNEHIIICTTDMGLQNSYDGGKTFNRMEITGNNYDIYNTCYDLYFDKDTKDLVYAVWASRHDAPYTPSLNDRENVCGAFALSNDGGKTWDFNYSSGLPSNSIPVKMSVVKKENSLTFAVATFNNGFYISYDNGKTFTSISSQMESYNTFIWGEDVVIDEDIVYCLTSPYQNESWQWQPSKLYKHDLNSNTTTQINLGEIVLARSLSFNKDSGLFVNVIPTYHYEWMEEYNNGLWVNDNGGIYKVDGNIVTKYFENNDGIFHSDFAPNGDMYAVDTYGKVFVYSNSEWKNFANDLFTMLKNVSFSLDGEIVYITTFGGGTYKFNLGSK